MKPIKVKLKADRGVKETMDRYVNSPEAAQRRVQEAVADADKLLSSILEPKKV